MARQKVTVDNLAATVQGILQDYEDGVIKSLKEATHKVALTGVRALQSGSLGKKYPTGWRTWSETTRTGQRETLYNAKQPGLTHLLEKGHATRKGGRTRAIVHIQPVEEELIRTLEREIRNDL